ncbi:single-stranded-DNA-specific exonuclease RecJ [Rhizobium tropici CIAT 899]|uniref:Single-stranded-DNA-specific exonuclease RecJ n=1 Tax=Rhizobium tropici TaxID=398 RepID=A0A6P1CCV0_RHITR|nr:MULTISPECIES: single-stranded-DNA-specific exonuclease RecJ [Rhizobium]AGB71011.1 single-stranded-DNA-specific exonuclease RecJ [Rhizobium tropici CIAT 899]MBB4242398.1 single-stranded-DNA-specific exonuclease [Rhizobium tropici]MBB5594041.1 single-stranded-DNA-specific exonuclease [Rhizobium tropici]MBB6492838.1 single-stranded-DNA-specific exonuclease [Rhizobium tropici]NEV13375.1 single-stranded-DNA-specific exonuclease RecJ [Rhizobium tropici]
MEQPVDPVQRAFLGVERSVSGNRWVSRLDQAGQNRALAIAQTHGLPELIARVLAGRGVGQDEAMAFLDPTIRGLMPDPHLLTDCEKAAQRLLHAIRKGETVAIFGDYDVDGAASSALLYRFLAHFGVPASIYIPDRIFEGYGPNPTAINQLIDNGATLIVTVDCGSTSFESLDAARARNVDVVVIDHHQVAHELPHCHALVNPNREDDLSGQGHLCAAGVVFMVLVAALRLLREAGDSRVRSIDLLAWLDIVALATVCDVVPLKGLNRAYVVKGLIAARHQGNLGLAALFRKAGLNGPVTPYHFGFLIGPRINAGGRIGDAALGARLLTLEDGGEAETIAAKLDELNRERQAMEAAMLQEAEAEALAEYGNGDGASVIVTARENWHPGIVGLIASRLKDKFRRPAFAIAFDPMGKGTGSGRSINGFDMGRMVRAAVDAGLLVKGGGHAMAAGLTVERSNLGKLRAFFTEKAEKQVAGLVANETLKIDGALGASGATVELIDRLETAGPYGSGHPQPVFALPSHRLRDSRLVGQSHIKITLEAQDGGRVDGIAFRAAETPLGELLLSSRGAQIHVAGTLGADHWQGSRRVQLRITDAAKAP